MLSPAECQDGSGILELHPDGYGFLRGASLTPSNRDIYVSMAQVRRFSLRTGDFVTGKVRPQRDDDKYSAMLYITEVNGCPADSVANRPAFDALTPCYPHEHITLEVEGGSSEFLDMRLIDLVAPIGFGQRGLIHCPPAVDKAHLLSSIANAASICHPDAVVMTLLLWLSNRVYVAEHLGNVIPLIILGCVVNSFCVPSILLVTFHRSWVEKIVQWGIRFLTKIHICKKPEQWQASAETTIEHFHGSLMDLVHHPMHLLAQLVISVVEMSCLMVVPLLVYRAMGLTDTPWYHVLTVSFLLFVSASYTPLPGASGAQEGGFLVYFGSVFTGGTVSVALLVWRFITYYLCLLVGCADSIFTSLRKRVKPIRHEKKGQTKEQS